MRVLTGHTGGSLSAPSVAVIAAAAAAAAALLLCYPPAAQLSLLTLSFARVLTPPHLLPLLLPVAPQRHCT